MNLNINSISAKLYRWFYGTIDMPQNLCPYFWKLVLMWAFILPYSILSLPVILMDLKDPDHRNTGERAGMGFIIWFILGMIVCMLSLVGLLFVTPTKDSIFMGMIGIGLTGWVFTVIFGTIYLVIYLKEKIKDRKYQKRVAQQYDENGNWIPQEKRMPKQNIIVEMVKAKYNKYCPKIDWK